MQCYIALHNERETVSAAYSNPIVLARHCVTTTTTQLISFYFFIVKGSGIADRAVILTLDGQLSTAASPPSMALPKVRLALSTPSLPFPNHRTVLAYNKGVFSSSLSFHVFERPCPRDQETERLVADPAPGISAAPHEDNLRYFDVTIQGPDGSPFQGASVPFLNIICLPVDTPLQMGSSSSNCSFPKNIQWRHPRCASLPRYTIPTSVRTSAQYTLLNDIYHQL